MIMKSLSNIKTLKKTIGATVLATMLLGTIFFQPGTAEAHCDTLDGPVVKAAQQALEANNINLILPYVYMDGEAELQEAFKKAVAARSYNEATRELADYYFFETAVRIHRAGEGETYTGLKPAGLDHGPALPAAEKALETGSVDELKELMKEIIAQAVEERFEEVMATREKANEGTVDAIREIVEAELLFEVYIHELYLASHGIAHGEENHGDVHQEHPHANEAGQHSSAQ